MYFRYTFQATNNYDIVALTNFDVLNDVKDTKPSSPLSLLERSIRNFSFFRHKIKDLITDGPNPLHPLRPTNVKINNKSVNIYGSLKVDEFGNSNNWILIYSKGKLDEENFKTLTKSLVQSENINDLKKSIQEELEAFLSLENINK